MQTIDRTVSILQAVAQAPTGLTLSELSRETGLPPATCHRLLGALASSAMVERNDSTKRWRPGLGLARIAGSVIPAAGWASLVDPVLVDLRDRWQECFYFSNLTDGEVICVRSVETTEPHRISVSVPLGRRMSLHASAAAKAILAQLTDDEALRLLRRGELEQFTSYTLPTVDDVVRDLGATRDRGFAVCDQEMELGVAAYAAAIPGPPGEAPRSFGVIGHRERLAARMRGGLLDALLTAAEGLSGATDANPPRVSTW